MEGLDEGLISVSALEDSLTEEERAFESRAPFTYWDSWRRALPEVPDLWTFGPGTIITRRPRADVAL